MQGSQRASNQKQIKIKIALHKVSKLIEFLEKSKELPKNTNEDNVLLKPNGYGMVVVTNLYTPPEAAAARVGSGVRAAAEPEA